MGQIFTLTNQKTFNVGTNASDIYFSNSLNIKTSVLIKMIKKT
jgi:hypothetical protein